MANSMLFLSDRMQPGGTIGEWTDPAAPNTQIPVIDQPQRQPEPEAGASI